MKNNYSSPSLWLQILERLQINDESEQRRSPNDEEFMLKEIHHLTIKSGDIFKHSAHMKNDKIHVEIQFCQEEDFAEIEQIIRKYETTTRLMLTAIPRSTVELLFGILFPSKFTINLKCLKICSTHLSKQNLNIVIQNCKKLKTLMLPNCKIEQVINLTDIITELPLLEHFDGLTTKGIEISPNIFNFLLQNRRVMKTFLIWPFESFNIDQIHGYLPFWETFVINTPKFFYSAGICVRLDSIFLNPLTDKVEFQRNIDFISDITNMIYKRHKETFSTLNENTNGWETFMVKTATRVQQIKEKCVYFELPTKNMFLQD